MSVHVDADMPEDTDVVKPFSVTARLGEPSGDWLVCVHRLRELFIHSDSLLVCHIDLVVLVEYLYELGVMLRRDQIRVNLISVTVVHQQVPLGYASQLLILFR